MYRLLVEVDGRQIHILDLASRADTEGTNAAEFEDSVLASVEIESRIEDAMEDG